MNKKRNVKEIPVTKKIVILYRDDFRSISDGYHLNIFDDILEQLNLPKNTDEIHLTYNGN